MSINITVRVFVCCLLGILASDGVTLAGVVSCPSLTLDKQVTCDGGLTWSASCLGWDDPNDPSNPYQPEVSVRYVVNTGDGSELSNCTLTESNSEVLGAPVDLGNLGANVTDQLVFQTGLLGCTSDLEANEPDTATLTCDCPPGSTEPTRTANDTADIECQLPALEIDKTCGPQDVDTELSPVNLTVTNPPNPRGATMVNCSIQERLIVPGPDIPVPFASGLFDLAPGESIIFDFDMNMPALGVAGDGLNAASVICQIDGAPGKIFVAGDQDLCETCQAAVDKQVSCDGGATWEDSCTGDYLDTSIKVRYLADVPGGDPLFNCVLTDSNGEVLAVPVDVGMIPGASSGNVIYETDMLECTDILAAGEPNTATLSCECYEDGSGQNRTVEDTAEVACCGDGVVQGTAGETCEPPGVAAGSGNLVQDGSFEAGTPNPFWTEFSTNFGSTLCDPASCGFDLAADGAWWSWFGGTSAAEEGIVSQPIVLPEGATATLEFALWLITCSNEASDFLEVKVNDDVVFSVDLTDARCANGSYTLETVDLSAYAGQSITLAFRAVTGTTGANGNIFLDLVSLEVFSDNLCRDECTFCGDGNLDPGEMCDDGNTDDFDGCSSACLFTDCEVVLDKQVSCDDGATWSDACTTEEGLTVKVRYVAGTNSTTDLFNCELTDSNGLVLPGPVALGNLPGNLDDFVIWETSPIECSEVEVSFGLSPYGQHFEELDKDDPAALADDGWLVFGNVFNPDFSYAYGYGPFPAPNGGEAFSAIVVNQGGPVQGTQQLSVYNDYNNSDHGAGRFIEANVFQERTISAEDVGSTWVFSFDAKRGNIEGVSTALAFFKTLDPGAGFALTNFITADMTGIPETWGRYSLSIFIDPSLVGQILQFGFSSTATGFEGSGIFYDNIAFRPSPDPNGATLTCECFASGSGILATDDDEATIDCQPAGVAFQMEAAAVSVGGTHVTVDLVNTYVDPIVVATVQYANNTKPVVTRVSNVTSTSFDVRLQNPSGGTPAVDTVHYWVVERGVWMVDGVKLEADRFVSTQVDRKGAWLWGVPRPYGQIYAQPVVLGQVMGEDDTRWSVFFAQGNNHFEAPTAANLKLGRHIGEDTDHSRLPETIGYIVVEAVHTNLAGVEFEAALGLDTVQGIFNGPPFPYNFNNPFGTAPTVAVVSSAGMDGGDGGWAMTYGPTMATTAQLRLSIDEDQIKDTDRSHATEQVAYAAFAGPMLFPVPPMCNVDADCSDGKFCNGVERCDANQVCRPGVAPCTGPCDEVGDVCLAGGMAKLESVVVPGTNGIFKSLGHTVNLSNSYVSPVIACTPVYDANNVPVVVRVTGVTSTSFEVSLQNPGNLATIDHDTINCLVVEEGSWMIDGHPVEAQKYLSVTTDKERNWLGTAQTLTHGFTNPVVLGQVMSTNDPTPTKWSVYWQRGAAQNQPPSAIALRNGKTVCEDPDGVRADETIGIIVFEQSNGTIGGVPFEARLGLDTVKGIDNGPPFNYTFNVPFASPPTHVVATQAGMDGSDGSWAYLYGETFSTATTLSLAVDEDQIFNAERSHTTEQVGYVAFQDRVVFPQMGCDVDADCDDGNFCNGAETCNLAKPVGGGTCEPGTSPNCDDAIGCTDDTCNEETDSCDNVPNDANCNNGLFCDGVETCNATLDCQGGTPVDCGTDTCDEVNDTCPGGGPVAFMEWGTVENVGGIDTDTPDKVPTIGTRVYLANTYVDPVIVASVRYANNTVPVVTRLTNVRGHRFDVYVQNPSGEPEAAETVDYIVVEKGTWVLGGVAIEAQKYESTKTAHAGDWSQFDTQSYGQSYMRPVVLGQVMSVNDSRFSAFWSRGPSRTAAPTSVELHTGKMTGEDPHPARLNETIGFIVIEAGHGFIDGIEFEAKVSTDSIQSVTGAPPYNDTFTMPFANPPAVAVAVQTAMDGGNGGWMYTFGATPTTTSLIRLAGDEDQLGDIERTRATEQAAYIVFQTPGTCN